MDGELKIYLKFNMTQSNNSDKTQTSPLMLISSGYNFTYSSKYNILFLKNQGLPHTLSEHEHKHY